MHVGLLAACMCRAPPIHMQVHATGMEFAVLMDMQVHAARTEFPVYVCAVRTVT